MNDLFSRYALEGRRADDDRAPAMPYLALAPL
jgi:hypothetical protein